MATRREVRRGAGRSSHNSVRTLPDGAETPWLNAEEWEVVYGWLYSSRSALVEEGLGRVEAWKARGGVPLMVELTADLCHCRMKERDKSSDGGAEVQSLILLYCMAITRYASRIALFYPLPMKRNQVTHGYYVKLRKSYHASGTMLVAFEQPSSSALLM